MRTSIVATASSIVLVAGCGAPESDASGPPPVRTPDISNIEIEGDRDQPVNTLAMQAIADLQAFWEGAEPNG